MQPSGTQMLPMVASCVLFCFLPEKDGLNFQEGRLTIKKCHMFLHLRQWPQIPFFSSKTGRESLDISGFFFFVCTSVDFWSLGWPLELLGTEKYFPSCTKVAQTSSTAWWQIYFHSCQVLAFKNCDWSLFLKLIFKMTVYIHPSHLNFSLVRKTYSPTVFYKNCSRAAWVETSKHKK